MALVLTIGGVALEIRKRTLSIPKTVEGRSTAFFIVADSDASDHYVRGDPVIILDGANTLFKGLVYSSKENRMAPAGGLYHTVKCMDWHYLADKRLVAESYTDQTAGAIVADIRTNYLAAEGVTVGTIQAGPTIAEAVFNYAPASTVLDVLAERAGFTWYIDEEKVLYFVVRTTTPASFAVTPAVMLKGSSSLTHGNPKYRNRQYLRGGKAITAVQTETFTTQDDTIQAFQVGYPLAQVPVSIKEDGGADKSLGIKGIDTAKDYYWSKGDEVIVAATAPGASVVVEIKYYGQYDIIALAEDANAIAAQLAIEGAGTGFVDHMADDPSLIDKDDALDEAEAKLAKYAVAGKQVTFTVTTNGLEPGQLVTVTESLYTLNAADLLITAVEVVEADIGIVYRVTAVVGPVLGGWERFFLDLARAKEDVRLIAGTANQILIILSITAELWEWAESIVENVYACTTCDSVVVGGTTPVVC